MKHSRPTRLRHTAGVTLIEVVIAVTLLSLLSVGMLMALRIGIDAFGKTSDKLMDNRRVAGAQRILTQEVQGMLPVVPPCLGLPQGQAGGKFVFFQGQPRTMRFVSLFSLQQGWRGQPQILEFTVIPGDNGRGVRLVVNELPYTGQENAGRLCLGFAPDSEGTVITKFPPVETGPNSFVLADQLEYCRFAYLWPAEQPSGPSEWKPAWKLPRWPLGIRIEMAPLEPDPSKVQPITVTVPIYQRRWPELPYADI